MTAEEFIEACKSTHTARAGVVKKYVKEQGDRTYTDDDFVEVFRRDEHLLYLEKSRNVYNFHREYTAKDSHESD